MEQGNDDSGCFLAAEKVRREERDQYCDEDRRNPVFDHSQPRIWISSPRQEAALPNVLPEDVERGLEWRVVHFLRN